MYVLHLKLLNTDILGKALTDIQHSTCAFGTGTSACTTGPSQKLEGGLIQCYTTGLAKYSTDTCILSPLVYEFLCA